VEEEKSYVGIDVSAEQLDLAVNPTGQTGQYPNSKNGIAKLVTKMKTIQPQLIIMEATGGWELALKQALDEAGLAAAVINPKRVRDHGRAMGFLAKTDKIDAKIIAHFAATINPQAQPARDSSERELDNLVTRRNQLSDMLTAESYRLRQYLDSSVQADIQEHIRWLESKIQTLDKELKERVKHNSSFQEKDRLYRSMKGVGKVLSMTLIAKLPELGRLNQKEIGSLVGLAPMNKDSGKFRGKRMIQGGRAVVRKVLYMPILSAIRYNPAIRDLYQRLIAKGKLQKVALTACMHKMLTILNAMAKTKTAWQSSAKSACGTGVPATY
jgi:transposase